MPDADRRRLVELVLEEEAVVVVVGLPLSLDGSEGRAAMAAEAEAEALRPARSRHGDRGRAVRRAPHHRDRPSGPGRRRDPRAGPAGGRRPGRRRGDADRHGSTAGGLRDHGRPRSTVGGPGARRPTHRPDPDSAPPTARSRAPAERGRGDRDLPGRHRRRRPGPRRHGTVPDTRPRPAVVVPPSVADRRRCLRRGRRGRHRRRRTCGSPPRPIRRARRAPRSS